MRAGNSSLLPNKSARTRKYPHARGEQRFTFTRRPADAEIPPCARGTEYAKTQGTWIQGNTPMRAGNSCRARKVAARRQKYPHARGEQV